MSQSCCVWKVHQLIALPSLYTSLGIDSECRTIDIDVSDQVHQIGGRFDEALSTSLSIHGAHQEALRRIEHYSMTSMHSSAHSIRSMDSIRTELSRLEAMITSASVTHPSKTETGNSHARRGSSHTERGIPAVEEGGTRTSNLSLSDLLPEHSGNRSTARDSGIKLNSRQGSFNEARKSLELSSQSQRTREMAVEQCVQPAYQMSSADYRSFLDESDDMESWSMWNPATEGNPAAEGNRSSFLYAEFSKDSEPRQHESPAVGVDCGAIHRILRQSLASSYPPEVVDYVSLRQITSLCEDHIGLLDKKPKFKMSAIGKMKERSSVDDRVPASARQSMIDLKYRLIELHKAIKASREKCTQVGYSLSELDNLLLPPGSISCAPINRPPSMPEIHSGDDSSSLYSEDFHSPAE